MVQTLAQKIAIPESQWKDCLLEHERSGVSLARVLVLRGLIKEDELLKALAEQCDGLKVEIEGHASSEGEAKRNQELSEMRSAAVKKWLIDQGVKPEHIANTVGYGSSRPVIPEPKPGKKVTAKMLEDARKQNRRIAVRVVETCK